MSTSRPTDHIDLFLEKQRDVFSLLESMVSFFDRHLSKDKPVNLAVSGGPDSMYMAHCIFYYYFTTGQDLSNITILHYHHAQRTQSDEELVFLENYFSGYKLILDRYRGKESNERSLRNARRKFFGSHIGSNQVVVTGHNLSDRVETTFLHLKRGAGLPGVLNMEKVDKKHLTGIGGREKEVVVLRPLLSISKENILDQCIRFDMPYFVDASNDDESYSMRNALRKSISLGLQQAEKLGYPKDLFWKELVGYYNLLEETRGPSHCSLTSLNPSPLWPKDLKFYCSELPQDVTEVYGMLSDAQLLSGISTPRLEEIMTLIKKKSGRTYMNNAYFFVSHRCVYMLVSSSFVGTNFWSQHHSGKVAIKKAGSYSLGGFTRQITDKKHIGACMRFPKRGDKMGGKSLKKWMINHKIPVFWRNQIPVLEKQGKILAVLPLELLQGYI